MVQENTAPLSLANNVGQPQLALPTLMSYLRLFGFCDGRPSLVFDSSTKKLDEPCIDEEKWAMGFPTCTTCAPTPTKHKIGKSEDKPWIFILWFSF